MSDVKALRDQVVRLDAQGKSTRDIKKAMQMFSVGKNFVTDTLRRYREFGTTGDRPRSGRPRTKRTPQVIKRVREKIRRNPRQRQTDLAREHDMARSTMQDLLRKDLNMRSYRLRPAQLLSEATKEKRRLRCKAFLDRLNAGTLPNAIFSDEKLFTVEAKFNRQNHRILSSNIESLPTEVKCALHRQKPASVMV